MNWLGKLLRKTPQPPPAPPRVVAMSDVTCRYCASCLPQEDAASGICDGCWHESKLAPMDWLKRLKALGRPAPGSSGGTCEP